MNLSMWMLLDELSSLNPKSEIKNGSATIEGFRLFSSGDTSTASYVYIGYAREFIDDDSGRVLLVHRSDVIIVEHAQMPDIINIVISAFDKYRDWDERLQLARFELQPYQAILNVAHEVFQCPMFFGNKNLHIYAITQQYTKDQVYDEWEDVKRLLTMPFSFMERLKYLDIPPVYPDEVDPAVMPTWQGMRFKYQIRTNCYLNNSIWGHFYLYYNKDAVSPAILQLTRHVADVYGKLLYETQEKSSEKYSMYSWLVDILNGQTVPAATIQTFCWTYKWTETDTLMLYKVGCSATVIDQMLFYWMCDSISELSDGAFVFPYKESIVAIVRDVNKQPQIVLDGIARLLNVGDFHCGVSFSFKGLQNIADFYSQAGYAIELGPDNGNRVHFYKNCALEGLTREVKSRLHWQSWVTPALFRLIESDQTQGTEYYMTLYQLLLNKGHLGNAAKALFIHRNTLLYRLEKIEHLIEMDIHDENNWAYLRFCYLLMKDNYPAELSSPAKK